MIRVNIKIFAVFLEQMEKTGEVVLANGKTRNNLSRCFPSLYRVMFQRLVHVHDPANPNLTVSDCHVLRSLPHCPQSEFSNFNKENKRTCHAPFKLVQTCCFEALIAKALIHDLSFTLKNADSSSVGLENTRLI